MLEKLLLIAGGAAGLYFAFRTWPRKMPLPCPCGSSGNASVPLNTTSVTSPTSVVPSSTQPVLVASPQAMNWLSQPGYV